MGTPGMGVRAHFLGYQAVQEVAPLAVPSRTVTNLHQGSCEQRLSPSLQRSRLVWVTLYPTVSFCNAPEAMPCPQWIQVRHCLPTAFLAVGNVQEIGLDIEEWSLSCR